MIDIKQLWLAGLQGISEFLPISSSAHLLLLPKLLNWQAQNSGFHAAIHLGSLIAVVWGLRQYLTNIGNALVACLGKTCNYSANARLGISICLSTIPVALVGWMVNDSFLLSDNLNVIASNTIVFAILLGFAYYRSSNQRKILDLSWQEIAMVVGSQIIAFVPGTSRLGVTMSVALLRGLNARDAAILSLLISIPITTIASVYKLIKLSPGSELLLPLLVTAASGIIGLRLFMLMLRYLGLYPVVLYRIVLGFSIITLLK